MAVRRTQGRNRAAGSTQRGVTHMAMRIVVHVLSLSGLGLGFQIKYNVTKVRKTTTFLFKTFILQKNKCIPPLLHRLGTVLHSLFM